MTNNYCGECIHYMGGGDWDLCCSIPHPTLREREIGIRYDFGFLCYENTPACEEFERRMK